MDVGALQAQLKALRKQESEFLTVSRGSRRMIKSEENRLAIQKVRQQLKEAGAPDLTLAEKRKLRAGQTEAGTSGSVEAVDFAPGDFVETPHGTGKVRQVHSDHLQVLMDEHEPGYPLRSIPKSDVKKFLNEATKTESDALPTVPTGETGTGITEEPPRGYVRGTKIVRGYPPTHMLNNC
jgi:hypothetical protein